MEKPAFTRPCLSDNSVIMAIMCEPLVELICQVAMGWIPALEYLPPGTRGAYGCVLSYKAVNVASRDPGPW
jgi:hypothetical protein